MMNPMSPKFIDFLQQDLAIPSESINLVLRDKQAMPHQFPMLLWQYGLVDKQQLEDVFDWLDDHYL